MTATALTDLHTLLREAWCVADRLDPIPELQLLREEIERATNGVELYRKALERRRKQ